MNRCNAILAERGQFRKLLIAQACNSGNSLPNRTHDMFIILLHFRPIIGRLTPPRWKDASIDRLLGTIVEGLLIGSRSLADVRFEFLTVDHVIYKLVGARRASSHHHDLALR